jgi:hypothetical protein
MNVSAFGTADTQILTTGSDVMAPTSGVWLILKATVNNQNASAQTVTEYRVPSGDVAGVTNIIVDALSVDPDDTVGLRHGNRAIVQNLSVK